MGISLQAPFCIERPAPLQMFSMLKELKMSKQQTAFWLIKGDVAVGCADRELHPDAIKHLPSVHCTFQLPDLPRSTAGKGSDKAMPCSHCLQKRNDALRAQDES